MNSLKEKITNLEKENNKLKEENKNLNNEILKIKDDIKNNIINSRKRKMI